MAKGQEDGRRKITKTVVDDLEASESDYTVFDTVLTGFGVRVWPSGKKTFIASYRYEGRKRKVTLGKYGVLTVEQARAFAKDVLAKAVQGVDTAAMKARKRGELTMAALCDEYLDEGCTHKTAGTVAGDKGRIKNHIKPVLGTRRIFEITSADIAKLSRSVAAGKTKGAGGKYAASRTVRLLGGIFTYAVKRGYLATNPRSGVETYKDNRNQRFLDEPELQRLGAALIEAETVGLPYSWRDDAKAKHRPKDAETRRTVVSPHAVAAIRLLALTGLRLRQVLHARWDQVDVKRGFLALPPHKRHPARVVPLGADALAILADLPKVKDCPFVIVGETKDKPRADLKKSWPRIRDRAGLKGVRLHDLRHTVGSHAAASGMGLPMVGALLGHRSPTTTNLYAHFAETGIQQAANNVGGTISALLNGQPSAEIIPMRAAE